MRVMVPGLFRRLNPGFTLAASLALPLAATPPAVAKEAWPSRVIATYKVAFNGVNIGKFTFVSEISDGSYSLGAEGELSALFGAFKWRGNTASKGALIDGEPQPVAYTFDFKSTTRNGSVKLGFNDNRIDTVSVLPESDTHPDTVPVKAQHLKAALDPLSAVMLVSRGTTNPCNRKVPIFDGKQRFDLVFSFARQQNVAEVKPSGQPRQGFVCQVRYVPIAGYRMNDETKQMVAARNIEVALRPVPTANLMVPYRVSIPTFAGTATLTSHRIEITTDGKGQIALVN